MPSKIKKRGENSYLLTISAGSDSHGRQINHTKTVKASSLLEAKRMYNEFATEVQRGNIISTRKLKIRDFATRWFSEYCEKHLAPKTQRSYKLHLFNRIVPALGNIDIAKLKPMQIIDFLSNLSEPGLRLDGKSGYLGDESIMYCFRVLSSMLNDATEWQVIPNNPAERVKPPTVKKKKQTMIYNEKQSQLLLKALKAKPLKYQIIVLLAIASGLRLGELCGLEWKDFDFDNCCMTVTRASQSLSKLGTFEKDPKNAPSNRTITLPLGIFPLLQEFKTEQNTIRLKMCGKWLDSDRLFTQSNGKPIYVQTPSKWFDKFLNRYNKLIDENENLSPEQKENQKLPIIRFHDLRHLSGSLLIAKGIPLKNVSTRLGHADIRTTANIYSHSLQSVDKRAANVMDDILFKNK